MKSIKKAFYTLTSIFIASIILFYGTVSASAYKAEKVIVSYTSSTGISGDFLISSAVYSDNFIAAVDRVAEAALNFEQEVDISDLNISYTDFTSTFIDSLRYSHPELINISNRLGYSYNPDSGMIITVSPRYLFDESEGEKYFGEFNAVVDRVALEAGKLGSDFLKALYVHDFIAANAEYSYTVSDPSVLDESFVYNAYGNLIDKHLVCQGYTMAYGAILNELGIENGYAVSDSMNHVWNTVTIDGKTYHVDVTFDDPLNDLLGRVSHESFLCTDAEIISAGHSDWVTDNEITQESYPGRFWDDINSKIIIIDDELYYPAYDDGDKSYMEKRNIATNQVEKFNSMLNGNQWTVVENPLRYYPGNYSRLEYLQGRIYYSTPTGVNSILPDGTDDRQEYALSAAASGRLYGFVYTDEAFYGETAATPNENGEIIALDISLTESMLICGDVNGDEKVTLLDAIMLMKSRLSLITLTEEQLILGDVTGDNKIGLEDVMIIQKYASAIKVAYDVGKPYPAM